MRPPVIDSNRIFVSAISADRSEEHTSELQSQSNLVCRLLLEKKKHLQIHASPRPHQARVAREADMRPRRPEFDCLLGAAPAGGRPVLGSSRRGAALARSLPAF